MNIPVLFPLLALAAGILLGFSGSGHAAAVIAFGAGIAVYFFILGKSSNPVSAYRYSRLHRLWIILIFAGIGILDMETHLPFRMPEDSFAGYRAAVGRIADISARTGGDRAVLEITRLERADKTVEKCRNFKALIYSDAIPHGIDDIVTVPAGFLRISDNPNSFAAGYAASMERRGFLYSLRVAGHDIHKTGHRRTFAGAASASRDRFAALIEESALDKSTQNFLISILLGDRSYLDPSLRQRFADAGVAHVLALSGMHLGIISAVLLFLLFPMNFAGLYRYRLLLTMALLWIYTVISGMAPSTTRACIMLTLVAAAVWLERPANAFGALCAAAFLILLFSPQSLFDVGFQLSFTCVAALTLIAPQLNRIDRRNHPHLFAANGLVIATVTCTFVSWIITAAYFDFFPALFLPANIIILPLLPLYLTCAGVYMLLSASGVEWMVLGRLVDAGYSGFLYLTGILGGSGNGALHVSVAPVSAILWLAACAMAAVAMHTGGHKWKKLTASALFALAVFSLAAIPPNRTEGFIITSGYRNVEIVYAGPDGEQTLLPHRNTLSAYTLHDKKITVLDCPYNPDMPRSECGILLITSRSRCTPEIADSIAAAFRPDCVVLHTSLRRKREATLAAKFDSLGIPCHSLRENPYRHIRQ